MGRKRLYIPVNQRGIAMTHPLVILTKSGDKTATRRLKGLEKINIAPDRHVLASGTDDGQTWEFVRNGLTMVTAKCPFGKVGDFLYLKEPFIQYTEKVFVTKSMIEHHNRESAPWKSPRFMPKVAASVWVEITGIYPERLSDLSEDDIHDEGIVQVGNVSGVPVYGVPGDEKTATGISPRVAWNLLFESCFGPMITDQNPWVWAIHYQLTEKPILK